MRAKEFHTGNGEIVESFRRVKAIENLATKNKFAVELNLV
jgi:hypothetical protein